MNDLYKPFRPNRDDKHYLKVSHVLTLVWGIVQIGVALAVRNQPGSALSMALSIASLINGPILGVFLVGTFLRRVSQPPALDRHAREHRIDAVRVFCDEDCVDVVRVSRQPDHVCGGVAGELCFLAAAKTIGPMGPVGPIAEKD